ncbi:hypothetical protein ACLMJK_002436 [Lecanora helva]
MPFIHPFADDRFTHALQQTLRSSERSTAGNTLHKMDINASGAMSLQDELRLHARYIRDTLVPILARQSKLTQSDNALLRSILKRLDSTQMTLDLLRYSRMEKALMVIAATGASTWPMEIVMKAEELIQKWEDELGPLKNLRADLHGPGGRLEGVRKLTDGKKESMYEKDDELKSAWSVKTTDPFRSYECGSLGFDVGDWWLKPAAAYRDGIIDHTSHAITADHNGAYAIVVNGSKEENLQPDGTFTYHASLSDPGALKLTKTMTTDTEKIVRVLRSWKLRSKLAPKAGLRYDGLYRIESFGIKLLPPESWHKTFVLSRMLNQPPIATALAYPMSDQLDDWRDYQHLKNVDRGDDFAMLREMIREPTVRVNETLGGEDMERIDSGYFSRRNSRLSSRIGSIPSTLSESRDGSMSAVASRIHSLSGSIAEEVDELGVELVREDTSVSPESKSRIVNPRNAPSALDGVHDVLTSAISEASAEKAQHRPISTSPATKSDINYPLLATVGLQSGGDTMHDLLVPGAGHDERDSASSLREDQKRNEGANVNDPTVGNTGSDPSSNVEYPSLGSLLRGRRGSNMTDSIRSVKSAIWLPGRDNWRNSGAAALDGIEESGLVDWASRRQNRSESADVAPEDLGKEGIATKDHAVENKEDPKDSENLGTEERSTEDVSARTEAKKVPSDTVEE